jgi:hypothetical protein
MHPEFEQVDGGYALRQANEILRVNQRGNRTIIQVIETPPTRGNPSFAKSLTGGEKSAARYVQNSFRQSVV